MKRYLLFAFDNYYPGGGWNDFVDDFDDLESAMEAGRKRFIMVPGDDHHDVFYGNDYFHVIDITTKEYIFVKRKQ